MNDYRIEGDITTIYLDRRDGTRLECLVDTKDLEKIFSLGVKWTAKLDTPSGKFYVKTTKMVDKKRYDYFLHRFILEAPKGMFVDHRDGNPLNNTRENIRIVTPAQNNQNFKTTGNKTSGIRGVHWDTEKKKWRARVHVNGKTHSLGYFIRLEDAEKVAIEARKELLPFSVD